jgi:hypothetical protein
MTTWRHPGTMKMTIEFGKKNVDSAPGHRRADGMPIADLIAHGFRLKIENPFPSPEAEKGGLLEKA